MSSSPRPPVPAQAQAEAAPAKVEPAPAVAPPGRPRQRPRRQAGGLWPLLVRLHFYAGIFVAPFLVTAALTGLAFTLTPTLDGYVYHAYLHPARAEGTQLPLVDQVRAARQAHPEGTIAAIAPPDGPDATTMVILNIPELGEKQRTVYVDPYTGRVRGDLITWFDETPLMTWFDDLHRNLHLGVAGRHYSELAASWLWVLVGGGLLLWLGRPRTYRSDRRLRRALLPDRGAGGVRGTRTWHAATGLWLAVGLLALSATGLTWSRYAGANFTAVLEDLNAHTPEIDATLPDPPGAAVHPDDPADPGGAGEPGGGHHTGAAGHRQAGADLPAGIDVDRVVAVARAAGLDGPIQVSPPADQASGWIAKQVDDRWPIGRDQVAIDPSSGQVFATSPWAEHPLLAKLSDLGVLAHMGLLFGPVNQLVLAGIAVGLLAVIVWGYSMWWQRRPTRNLARSGTGGGTGNGDRNGEGGTRNGVGGDRRARPRVPRMGRPPARGAWRGLPWALLVPGIVVVAAVGWALPMLGVSLLGFLLVDVVAGVLRRRRAPRTPPGPAPSST